MSANEPRIPVNMQPSPICVESARLYRDYVYAASPPPAEPTFTAQQLNRHVEAAREEFRRLGYSEGYAKGWGDAERLTGSKQMARVLQVFQTIENARVAAAEKADAVDCYDADNVRLSYAYHALQLKKLLNELEKLPL